MRKPLPPAPTLSPPHGRHGQPPRRPRPAAGTATLGKGKAPRAEADRASEPKPTQPLTLFPAPCVLTSRRADVRHHARAPIRGAHGPRGPPGAGESVGGLATRLARPGRGGGRGGPESGRAAAAHAQYREGRTRRPRVAAAAAGWHRGHAVDACSNRWMRRGQ